MTNSRPASWSNVRMFRQGERLRPTIAKILADVDPPSVLAILHVDGCGYDACGDKACSVRVVLGHAIAMDDETIERITRRLCSEVPITLSVTLKAVSSRRFVAARRRLRRARLC